MPIEYFPHSVSQAPMMDWSTRHQRRFMRSISRHALLYTEMVTAKALIHGNHEALLKHSPEEYPLALQLGGSDPEELAKATQLAGQHKYYEINLNLGCPSDRVQSGRFGACLMAEPELVKECLSAMQSATNIPISAKIRIGIDNQDPDETLIPFVEKLLPLKLANITIHARKALLNGLSPKQNREIPELQPWRAFDLKARFPEQVFILNGQLDDPVKDHALLKDVDGLMYGRAAYHTPWIFSDVDPTFFATQQPYATREAALRSCFDYLQHELDQGVYLSHFTRHILGLFHGMPRSRLFRRHLSESAHKPGADLSVIEEALRFVGEP